MHSKKWSKRLKRLVALSATTTMLLPNIVQAVEAVPQREKAVRNNYETIQDKSNISINKVDTNIDVTKDEKVSVIVEFNSPALAQAQSLNKTQKSIQNNISSEHEEFKNFLNKMKKEKSVSDFKIEHEYENVYNGVSMTLKGTEVEKLLESNVVKKVWNNEVVQLELPDQEKINTQNTNEVNTKMNDSVPHIGVDKLHKEGLKGEGVKVGVLDTGVDYNHPDLKDNYKGGYDYVDNDNDPMEATYNDWKESGKPEHNQAGSYYTSHGTHVSGTILGNAKSDTESKVLGVAPEADLHVYRVLGPYGSGATDGIIAAIEQSVIDGMDVINLSLGSSSNSPNSPLSVACNNSTLAGVVTVIANGNSGPKPGTVGSPGAAALPISVGASSTSIQLETFEVTSSAGSKLNTTILAKDYKTNLQEFASKEYNVVECGIGKEEDFTNKDVKGKLALIKRGELALVDKVSNAKKAGAVGVLLYNNIDGPINYYGGEGTDYVPAFDIDKVSGEKLVEELKNNENYKINFNLTGKVGTEGDKLADFSSRGPVIDGNIKPDVVAPGVNIRSTYPVYINDKENQNDYSIAYSRISGTSMATPHVAGVAALMVQDHKNDKENYTPEDIKLALMNTAKDLKGEYGVNEMGAGRIDAYEAVNPGITITNQAQDESVDANGESITLDHKTGSIAFGVAQKTDKGAMLNDELIIKNNTNRTKTFDVSVEYISASDSHGGLDAVKNGVKLETKGTATASKNTETKLGVNLIIPKGAEEGLYQGYINLVSTRDKNEKYQIPWSVKYLKGGISSAEIARNAISTNPDHGHPWLLPGTPGIISVNSPIKRLDFVIKDFETKKDIGYTTSYLGEWFAPGVEYSIKNIISMNPSVYPINEKGEKENIQIPLTSGKYIFEFRAIGKDGKISSKEFPLLIEDEYAKLETEIQPGVYELSEKDFTEEIDPVTGESHNAYWIKGKVDDNSINLLKEMGLNATKQNVMASLILNGMPKPGFSFYVDEEGKFKAGITNEDLNPSVGVGLVGMDIARNMPPAYPMFDLLKEGTSYMSLSIDKENLTLNDDFKLSINMQNIKNISDIKVSLKGMSGINIQKVELSEEFKTLLDEKGYTGEIDYKFNDYDGPTETIVNLKIKDKDGNLQNIDIDNSMLEVTYKVEDEHYISSGDLYIMPQFYASRFKDKDGNDLKGIHKKDIFERVKYDRKNSSLDIINIVESTAFGFDFEAKKSVEKNIWIEDPTGKRYDVTLDEWTESYIVKGLPASDEVHTIIYEVPGHFRKVGKVIPSLVQDGKIKGKYCVIGSGIFNGVALAGDTNKDGTIDIVDAKNIADVYKQTDKDKIVGMDLDFNGVVNEKDMKYVVKNFLEVNSQDKNAKTPQKTIDGKTLDDILQEIGYKK